MISVIDYDGGNFKSVINILKRVKVNYNLTRNKDLILKAVIFQVYLILVIV